MELLPQQQQQQQHLHLQNSSPHASLKLRSSPFSTALRQIIGFQPPSQQQPLTTIPHAQYSPQSPRSPLQDLLKGAAPQNNVTTKEPSFPQPQQQLPSDHPIVDIAENGQVLTLPHVLHRTRTIVFAAALKEPIRCSTSHTKDRLLYSSRKPRASNGLFLFHVSTSPTLAPTPSSVSMDFLDSCYLCRRRLSQGHDLFMYGGDKAFCSAECRYQQILMDERTHRGPPSVIRSGSTSATSHQSGHSQALGSKNMAACA